MTGDGMTAADGRRTTDDQLFAGFMADGMPGISALVVRNGNVLLRASHGLADVRASMPCTPATNYRLASITKQFTAAMIVLAYEHGLLKLEQSMCGVLPELPAFCQPITLHHLLNHTHGISDYEDLIAPETARPLVDADVLDLIVSRGARDFEPGSAYRYSNTGYALLAIIVERAFGVPFPEALRRFIFLPLGMATTLAYVAGGPEVTTLAATAGSTEGKPSTTELARPCFANCEDSDTRTFPPAPASDLLAGNSMDRLKSGKSYWSLAVAICGQSKLKSSRIVPAETSRLTLPIFYTPSGDE